MKIAWQFRMWKDMSEYMTAFYEDPSMSIFQDNFYKKKERIPIFHFEEISFLCWEILFFKYFTSGEISSKVFINFTKICAVLIFDVFNNRNLDLVLVFRFNWQKRLFQNKYFIFCSEFFCQIKYKWIINFCSLKSFIYLE